MRISYYAVFNYDDDGINVSFPDLPSAFTCGFSKRHAKKMAKEVLTLVLHGEKVSDLPQCTCLRKGKISDKQFVALIHIRMRVKNGFLNGKNVIEYNY